MLCCRCVLEGWYETCRYTQANEAKQPLTKRSCQQHQSPLYWHNYHSIVWQYRTTRLLPPMYGGTQHEAAYGGIPQHALPGHLAIGTLHIQNASQHASSTQPQTTGKQSSYVLSYVSKETSRAMFCRAKHTTKFCSTKRIQCLFSYHTLILCLITPQP